MKTHPFSDRSVNAIPRLRQIAAASGGSLALVGGQTAQSHDTDVTVANDAKFLVPAILIVIFLILILLLRAAVARRVSMRPSTLV